MTVEWSEKQRGPFPFDYVAEILDKLTLEARSVRQTCAVLSE
jgi:hypothetical protein